MLMLMQSIETNLATIDVRSIQQIERKSCQKIYNEPALEVVERDGARVRDHFALPVDISSPEVEYDI